jgi:hypothetical protein
VLHCNNLEPPMSQWIKSVYCLEPEAEVAAPT